jgi:hypothetical protein
MNRSDLPGSFASEETFDSAIWLFLMEGGTATELEDILSSVCGSVWNLAPEPVFAQVWEADLNLDERLDRIVSLTLPYGDGMGEAHVFVYTYGGGGLGYHLLFRRAGAGSRAEGLYAGGGASLLLVEDLNHNSYPEIVFEVRWELQSELYVYELVGIDFKPLIEEYSEIEMTTQHHLTFHEGFVEIMDVEGDGAKEILWNIPLQGPDLFIGEIPIRSEIWAWDAALFSHRDTVYEPTPTYRYEAFLMGDFAFRYGDIEQAVAFYQQAVFDEALLGWSEGFDPWGGGQATPDPAERARINGYGRYRILLSHAFQGYDQDAQTVLSGMVGSIEPGSDGWPFVELAQVFWDAYQLEGNYFNACSEAIRFSEEYRGDLLRLLGPDFYGGYSVEYTPEDMCPYPRQG